ncbi:hypothetical protein TRICI_002583 [Trichomonascus ciferrii]|uniref:CENP-V/GFA domain-containing protein n=1 Tax=Trichomonascus ciferrii TaxID=44093 RepID=A0A642V622_9ASCO|nr:hypothetical protein TRICI_002583 [Trichomonascus ciferrii]
MSQVSGACVCQNINITVKGSSDKIVVCYCSDCRKMSGHLGQIIAIFNKDQVEIKDPNNKLKTYAITNTASGKPNNVNFCEECGSTINSVPMVYDGKLSLVRTTVLDDGYEKYEPTEAIFSKDKCSYADKVSNL